MVASGFGRKKVMSRQVIAGLDEGSERVLHSSFLSTSGAVGPPSPVGNTPQNLYRRFPFSSRKTFRHSVALKHPEALYETPKEPLNSASPDSPPLSAKNAYVPALSASKWRP